MKNKRSLYALIVIGTIIISALPVGAQMTDEAVVTYVKEGMAKGKSQDALIQELLARGVTKEQALRIRDAAQSKGMTGAVREAGVQERSRRMGGTMSGLREETLGLISGQMSEMPDSLFKAGKVKTLERNGETYILQEDIDSTRFQIFGHNLFNNQNLTFAPNENIATPENYRLGPGDEVIIDIWGTNQNTIRQEISPDGFINIEGIGLLYLGGMTVKEAEKYARKQLNQIYSLDGEDARSEIKLTLGALRTIQVNVMGEVAVPGTYFLSSLSSVYHALYRAGGFTDLGSLRNIELIRNGKTIKHIDIYQLLVMGKAADGITLQDGDIVLVPAYESIVDIAGNVKRPMKYEMKDGETVADVIGYSGGFKGDAYTANLNLIRRNGREYQVYTVLQDEYGSFPVMDADSLTVGQIIDRYENRLEIKGAVYRPGTYQLSDKLDSVNELVGIADGLKGDAFTNRAIIQREREDLTLETIAIDLGAIMRGEAEDVTLKANDILYVSSIHDLQDLGTFTVEGEVARPGSFVFADNTTLEDAIMQAGGLLESASTVKIDVTRRIKDATSSEQTEDIAEVFTFSFKDGYVLDGEAGFVLQPYDYVFVRKSPSYNEQTTVDIRGEVAFPGAYALTKRTERLSDLVAKAGGVNQWAYVKGARLSRQMSAEEETRMRSTMEVMDSARDSIDTDMLNLNTRYFVGIDLEAALAAPGGAADLVLREGDILLVPQYNNTVRISGNVLYPNTVTYSPDMTIKDCVQMAGGYGFRSKKSKAYVIYMNGTVARARRFSKTAVQPGCEIVVPKKREKEGALQEVLGVATTASSIATMMATITNLIR